MTGAGGTDKVVLGFIGVAGRGYEAHILGFGEMPDVEIGAVCDVYQPYVDRAVAHTNGKAKAYHDYHDLLADPSLDAVVISTPPHWHALMSSGRAPSGQGCLLRKADVPLSRRRRA